MCNVYPCTILLCTSGVLGLIWYVFWLWLCFEKPSLHPTISARELNYIESSLGAAKQSAAPTILNTPWKEFFTSMPVYAIIVANFCRSWNFYLLVLFQASYLHSFNFEVSAVSFAYYYTLNDSPSMPLPYFFNNKILFEIRIHNFYNC